MRDPVLVLSFMISFLWKCFSLIAPVHNRAVPRKYLDVQVHPPPSRPPHSYRRMAGLGGDDSCVGGGGVPQRRPVGTNKPTSRVRRRRDRHENAYRRKSAAVKAGFCKELSEEMSRIKDDWAAWDVTVHPPDSPSHQVRSLHTRMDL